MYWYSKLINKIEQETNEIVFVGIAKCVTNASTTTVAKLFLIDESLMNDSNDYKIHSTWFPKVYLFLRWQHEVVNILLHNLVYFDNESIDRKDHKMKENDKPEIESAATKDKINDWNKIDQEENIFLSQFDLLTSFHIWIN